MRKESHLPSMVRKVKAQGFVHTSSAIHFAKRRPTKCSINVWAESRRLRDLSQPERMTCCLSENCSMHRRRNIVRYSGLLIKGGGRHSCTATAQLCHTAKTTSDDNRQNCGQDKPQPPPDTKDDVNNRENRSAVLAASLTHDLHSSFSGPVSEC